MGWRRWVAQQQRQLRLKRLPPEHLPVEPGEPDDDWLLSMLSSDWLLCSLTFLLLMQIVVILVAAEII